MNRSTDSASKESTRQEEDGKVRRQSVNLFDEDAMSCQRPGIECDDDDENDCVCKERMIIGGYKRGDDDCDYGESD